MAEALSNSLPSTGTSLEDRFAISIEGGKIVLTPKVKDLSLSYLPTPEDLVAYNKFLPGFSVALEMPAVHEAGYRRLRTREYLYVFAFILVSLVTLGSVGISVFSGSIPSFIPILLSPLTAICGVVVGFYFGEQRE
jgi:hypothetical protein